MATVLSEDWLRDAAPRVNDDDGFGRVSEAFEATVVFGVDGADTAAAFADGHVTVLGDPEYETWDVAMRAPEETWEKMLAETPPPRHHDLIGAWLQADLVIEGDLRLAMRHLRPLKRLVAAFREVETR
ncbi:SCP2 sterol-binding domain-containing protein [Natronomonas salsuginis]|uniref:SCP2 sterol-binding domain-containing protein n=1 Tax=Natronomonas salsuginis TaxID=2217661 RepID=A0A4U5JAL6_9EURY|nr:SCP2 sterol-binding domain-containing protein [Natronomonas salsuginis]TKR26210.1 SCP2 sterol-binding domain-containing protein [Natronomonas salsuginis]